MSWFDAFAAFVACVFVLACVIGFIYLLVTAVITYGWVAVIWIVGVPLVLISGTALFKYFGDKQ